MTLQRYNGNRWTGALLMAVHLVALVCLPLLHPPLPAAPAAAIDANGAPVEGHSEATCTACRMAGVRFLPPVGSPGAAASSAERDREKPRSAPQYRTTDRLTSIAARAPPVSC